MLPASRTFVCKADEGFTLVELMTVLVIIGLVSSAVILSFPARISALDQQAHKLAGDLNVTAQEAVLTGRSTAAGFSDNGYSLYRYQNGDWLDVLNENWPVGVDIFLSKDTGEIDLPQTIVPIIIFEPTGLAPAFNLRMSDGLDAIYTVKSTGDGQIILDGPT